MSRAKRNNRNKKRIKNKKMNMWIKGIIIFLLVLFFVVIIFIFIFKVVGIQNKKTEFKDKDKLEIYELFKYEDYNNIKIEQQRESKETSINIIALGITNCEPKLYRELYDSKSDTYMFIRCINNVKQYIGVSDYTIMSLGANLSDIIYNDNEDECISDDFAIALKDAGVDLVNLANYNINNLGQEGLKNTIDILDNANIEHIGAYYNEDKINTSKIIEVKGIKIAFLGYTDKLKKSITTNNDYCVNMIDVEKIKSDIQNVEEQGAEFIVVSLDWQNQVNDKISKKHEQVAQEIIDNGADVIIGNINNKTNKIQIKQNDEGRTYCIAYSLGSFFSIKEELEISLNIDITKSNTDGSVKITKVNYNPMYMMDSGENVENRYKLIDLKQEIERYNAGIDSKITDEKFSDISERLNEMENKIEKE